MSERPEWPVGLRTVFAVLAMLLSAGCGQEAAYQLDLPGTTWEIVSVADKGLAAPLPTIEFSEDGDSANLTLACGEVGLGWVWDSDGSAISFGVEGRAPDCADLSGDDGEVLDALLAAEEWSVQDDRHITMGGENGVWLRATATSGSREAGEEVTNAGGLSVTPEVPLRWTAVPGLSLRSLVPLVVLRSWSAGNIGSARADALFAP